MTAPYDSRCGELKILCNGAVKVYSHGAVKLSSHGTVGAQAPGVRSRVSAPYESKRRG